MLVGLPAEKTTDLQAHSPVMIWTNTRYITTRRWYQLHNKVILVGTMIGEACLGIMVRFMQEILGEGALRNDMRRLTYEFKFVLLEVDRFRGVSLSVKMNKKLFVRTLLGLT